jgi:hypothetical protein
MNRNIHMGDVGAIRFADALLTNNCLIGLNLKSTSMGDSGAGALAAALIRNQTLTCLQLEKNQLTNAALSSMEKALEVNHTIQTLGIGFTPTMGFEVWQAFQNILIRRSRELKVDEIDVTRFWDDTEENV